MDKNKEYILQKIDKHRAEITQIYVEISKLEKQYLELNTGFKENEEVIYEGKKGILKPDGMYHWKFAAYTKKGELSSALRHIWKTDKIQRVKGGAE